jgi:hypothetical protein
MVVQGSGSAAATSVAIPAHQAGDMILIFARGTAAAPSVPAAGGTVPAWATLQTGLANAIGLTVCAFVATAANHTSGTWTNATHIGVLVLRPTAGTVLSTAAARSAVGSGNNTQTIVYPALTLADADGSSWAVRCGTRTVAVTAVGTAPTNYTNQIIQPAGASALMSVHTRAGVTTNPAADTVSTTGTNAAYRAVTVEVLEVVPTQTIPVSGVGSPAAFGAITARDQRTVSVSGVPPTGYVRTITNQAISGQKITGGRRVGVFGTVTPTFSLPQSVPVSGVASAQAFGAPTVKTAITRAPTGVSSAQAFGTPTVKASFLRTVAGVPSAQAFGLVLPQVAGKTSVPGVASAQSFGAITFRLTGVPVSVAGVPSAQAFGKLGLKFTVTGIPSAQQFGSINLLYRAPVGGVASAQQFGVPSTLRSFTVPGVLSAQAFGVARALYVVQPAGLASAQRFGILTGRPGRVILALAGLPSEQAFGAAHIANVWISPLPCLDIDALPAPELELALTPAAEQALDLEPLVCK